MTEELVDLSHKELDRLSVIERVDRGELSQVDAATMMKRSSRQIRRWLARYREEGALGLTSRKRGKPSNHRLADALREQIVMIITEQYKDFGPTLANEQLAERHAISVSTESVRQLMIGAGIWQAKRRRQAPVHQQRERRPRRGELIQIDGSPHAWFEERGPKCSLIVFVDDATGELMALRFAPQETTEAYMVTLSEYLTRHGCPVSIYSDRHSIFRAPEDTEEPRPTQFGRALATLDIEAIQASTPQAKGRVERVNGILQDRLVKEMRLRGVHTIEEANAFLPSFMGRYNQKFARPARNPVDAHRDLQHDAQALDLILSCQSERTISKNLEVRYNNCIYQLDAEQRRRRLRGKKVTVCEHYNGRISILIQGKPLDYKVFQPGVDPNPTEDGKTVNARVDRVLSKAHKPKPNHPWRTLPATEGGFREMPS